MQEWSHAVPDRRIDQASPRGFLQLGQSRRRVADLVPTKNPHKQLGVRHRLVLVGPRPADQE